MCPYLPYRIPTREGQQRVYWTPSRRRVSAICAKQTAGVDGSGHRGFFETGPAMTRRALIGAKGKRALEGPLRGASHSLSSERPSAASEPQAREPEEVGRRRH